MDPERTVPVSAAATLLDTLADRGFRLVIAAAGGGSGAVAALAGTPGASRALLEGLVPHAREAVDRMLGGSQESYCSSRASRRLAMHGWTRARALGCPAAGALGAAVTASLATTRPKLGDHRAIAAVQSLTGTAVFTLRLAKDAGRSRSGEEAVAAWLLLEAITAEATARPPSRPPFLLPDEGVHIERVAAPRAWQDLLAGTAEVVAADGVPGIPEAGRVVFPGSFDPLHEGHLGMAALAGTMTGQAVEFELSVTNVDKPPLDHLELQRRSGQFIGRRLWLTRAATFVEKVRVFPRAVFVLGADTFTRLWDPRYYGGSPAAAAEAAGTIAAGVAGLIVFGRIRDGHFAAGAAGDVPAALRAVSRFVPEERFRCDISSTILRREQAACDPP